MIAAPVQTANPAFYGGQWLEAGLGVNWASASGHRLALEWTTPLWQDLNGPQLERDWMLTLGWQFAFGS